MRSKINSLFTRKKFEELTDVRNIVLYIFTIVVLAITWSGVKTIQKNYELQREISKLQQQNDVLDLLNQNSALQNKYLASDQYLDLAARRELGLAGPGETVMIVPKEAALKYVDRSVIHINQDSENSTSNEHKNYIDNLQTWKDFLLGRKVSID